MDARRAATGPATEARAPGPAWLVSAATAAALAALVGVAFVARWRVLAASPYPVGVDGYFYPLQLRALLAHGTLAYPSSPLAFWLMAPLAALTDPIIGAKLGACLGVALAVLPAYGIGARLGGGRGAGLVAATLVAASADAAYLTTEFVKEGLGLTLALVALWAALAALARPTRARLAGAALAIVATLLTHKLAAGVVLAITVPAAIAEARARGQLFGRRLIYATGAALGVGACGVAFGLAFPHRLLAPHDLHLLGSLLTSHARWDGAALATPHLVLTFEHEAAVGAVLALLAGAALLASRHGRAHAFAIAAGPGARVALGVLVVLGLLIGLPWLDVRDPQGLGFRLRTAAFVPLALTGAVVASVAVAPLARRLGGRAPRGVLLAILAAVLALRVPVERTEGRVLAHPALVAAVEAAAGRVPPGATLIVPERHIAFMAAWYTGAPVSLRPEPVPPARRVRLLPLAFTGAGSPLEAALDDARRTPGVTVPIALHPYHRNGLVLVTEATWTWLLARLPPGARAYFAAWPTI